MACREQLTATVKWPWLTVSALYLLFERRLKPRVWTLYVGPLTLPMNDYVGEICMWHIEIGVLYGLFGVIVWGSSQTECTWN